MDTFKSTLVHTLELAVVLGASWLAVHFLGNDSEFATAVTAIVLGSLAKFARASESVPLADYVNKDE
jgi:hypothetical protein